MGARAAAGGSNDPQLLGNPTDVVVDAAAAEVYVSDGYLNRRVVVFDSETGRYKRHWGAYGDKPDDGAPVNFDRARPPPSQFFIVHCVRLSNDGLVYVCDRQRNRVQVFRKDGTFVAEAIVGGPLLVKFAPVRPPG
jgi:DNA-binding beta-propeller fold protein YncE